MTEEEIIKNVTAIFNNKLFIEEIFFFRQRRGIPDQGFSDLEEYMGWVEVHKSNLFAVEKDLRRIISRCRNIKSELVAQEVLITGILFNKLSFPKESVYNYKQIKINGLGFIEYTHYFSFLNKSTDKEIMQLTEEYRNILKLLKNEVKVFIPDEMITQSFLTAVPGNPGDMVYATQQVLEDLIGLGVAALKEAVNNITDFEIKTYQDKNKHISEPVQHIGSFALNRGLYPIAEIYWLSIVKEIDKLNEEKKIHLNRGIPFANAGVSQLAQGKTVEGLRNLFLALEDDEEVLIKLQHSNSDPERNLIETNLYTQFENRLFKRIISLGINVNLVELSDLIKNLEAEKRLSFFIYVAEYFNTLDEKNAPRIDLLSRGITLRALGSLTAWVEDILKKSSKVQGNKLTDLLCSGIAGLSFLKGETEVNSLDELQNRLQKLNSNNIDEQYKNAKATVYIRNFSAHNYQTGKHNFYKCSTEYFSRLINLILFLHKNKKLV